MAKFEITEETTLQEAVYLALGAASVCWEHPGGAGLFLSTECAAIGEELVRALRTGRLVDQDSGFQLALQQHRASQK